MYQIRIIGICIAQGDADFCNEGLHGLKKKLNVVDCSGFKALIKCLL